MTKSADREFCSSPVNREREHRIEEPPCSRCRLYVGRSAMSVESGMPTRVLAGRARSLWQACVGAILVDELVWLQGHLQAFRVTSIRNWYCSSSRGGRVPGCAPSVRPCQRRSPLEQIRRLRGSYRLGLLVVLAAAVTACKPKDLVEPPLKSRWALSADATRWTTLTVPSNLAGDDGGFEVVDVKPGSGGGRPGLHSSLLIHVLWPEMSGQTARNTDEFRVPGGGRKLTIMLSSPAIDVIAGKPFNTFSLQRRIVFDSLENVCIPTGRPVPDNVECAHRPPSVERDEFGLHLFGRDFNAYPVDYADFASQREILEERRPDGALESLITCTPDGAPANLPLAPQCAMFYLDPRLNALVQTHFRKTYLPEWKSIRQKVESLLSTFSKD